MHASHRRSAMAVLIVLAITGLALAIPAGAAAKRIPDFGGGCNPSTTTPGVAVGCYAFVDPQLQDDPWPTGRLTFSVPSFKGTLSRTSCDAAAGFCDVSYTPKGNGSASRKDTITIAYSGDTFWTSRKTTVVVAVPAKLPVYLVTSCDRAATTPGVPAACELDIYPSTSGPTPTGSVTLVVPTYKGTVSPASCNAAAGSCSFSYTPKGIATTTRKDTITATYGGDAFWGSKKATVVVEVHAP